MTSPDTCIGVGLDVPRERPRRTSGSAARVRVAWITMLVAALAPMAIAQSSGGSSDGSSGNKEKSGDAAPSERDGGASDRTPPKDDSAVETEAEQMRRRAEAEKEGIKPVVGGVGGAVNDGARANVPAPPKPAPRGITVPVARRAREGVFVIKQRGTLTSASTGDVIFVPDKDGPARTNRPMVLLPSQSLARLENAAGLQVDGVAPAKPNVVISGQVMVYRGREYLLPTAFQVVLASAEKPASASSDASGRVEAAPSSESKDAGGVTTNDAPVGVGGSGGATGVEPGDVGEDRSVEGLIQELEQRRSSLRGLSREMLREVPPASTEVSSAGGAASLSAPSGSTAESTVSPAMPEGASIVARRGRLVRLSDGATALAFDSHADSPAGARRPEAPMPILPCQMLERMENIVGSRGERTPMEVSGRVFTYNGRNYLLPTMYKVMPPTDVGPLN